MIKFSYKIDCSLRLQTLLNIINNTTYFENLIIRLYVLYTFNTCQILSQAAIIYYMIIFYA